MVEEYELNNQLDEKRPNMSNRWDQYHRFPQTIEDAPEAIKKTVEAVPVFVRRVVDTTKKLLDPFAISKLIMESVPAAVRHFAWYLILGIAAAWALFVSIIVICIFSRTMQLVCCFMKNSSAGIKTTTKCLKNTCKTNRHDRHVESVQELIHSNV